MPKSHSVSQSQHHQHHHHQQQQHQSQPPAPGPAQGQPRSQAGHHGQVAPKPMGQNAGQIPGSVSGQPGSQTRSELPSWFKDGMGSDAGNNKGIANTPTQKPMPSKPSSGLLQPISGGPATVQQRKDNAETIDLVSPAFPVKNDPDLAREQSHVPKQRQPTQPYAAPAVQSRGGAAQPTHLAQSASSATSVISSNTAKAEFNI